MRRLHYFGPFGNSLIALINVIDVNIQIDVSSRRRRRSTAGGEHHFTGP
jgi:hypothetical protein